MVKVIWGVNVFSGIGSGKYRLCPFFFFNQIKFRSSLYRTGRRMIIFTGVVLSYQIETGEK